MNNLERFNEIYNKMTPEELTGLTLRPQDLRLEVIPILQQELINRRLNKEAMSLTNFLVSTKEKSRFNDLSVDELKQLVKERLESGESIESIKIDLNDDGINVYNLITDEVKLKEKALDYIMHLKEEGLDENEIDTKLQDTLSIGKEDSEMLKVQLRKNGKYNLIFGYSITAILLLVMMVSLSVGGSISIGTIIVLALGVWRIYRGYEQLKK